MTRLRHTFHLPATPPLSANRWPRSSPEATVLVAVGTTRDLELVADAPGDWPFHCHMTHHVMNQMGHGIPNTLGVKSGAIDQRMRPLLPAARWL